MNNIHMRETLDFSHSFLYNKHRPNYAGRA